MSGIIQSVSSLDGLKKETTETAASEEFQVSEFEVDPLRGSAVSSISSSDNNYWDSCSNEGGKTDVRHFKVFPTGSVIFELCR